MNDDIDRQLSEGIGRHHLSQLEKAFRQGEIDLNELNERLGALRRYNYFIHNYNSEELKIQLHTIFMGYTIFGFEKMASAAVVQLLLADWLDDPNIDFGLELGVGDARICYLFTLYALTEAQERYEDALGWLRMAVPLLHEQGDWKGYLEAISEIGQCYAQLERYAAEIDAYAECLRVLEERKDMANYLSDYSTQDMVRAANAVFPFEFKQPLTDFADASIIRWMLISKIAIKYVVLDNYDASIKYSSMAVQMLDDKEVEPPSNSSTLLDLLSVHGLALANSGQYRGAIEVANRLLQHEEANADPLYRSTAARILSGCYSKLGNSADARRYKASEKEALRQLRQSKKTSRG